MFKKLSSERGDASLFPILIIILVCSVPMMILFIMNMDSHIINLQKIRYTKSVDMAVNTAVANIELSTEDDLKQSIRDEGISKGLNNTEIDKLIDERMREKQGINQTSIGSNDLNAAFGNLDFMAMGYDVKKRLVVNKAALLKTFYEVLMRNFQVKGYNKIESFKRFVPLKALVQYDTMSVSIIQYDPITKKYNDVWQDYRLFYTTYDKVDRISRNVYLTLGDKCYYVDETKNLDERFLEDNRTYFSVTDPNDYINNARFGITEEKKNEEVAKCVKSILRSNANMFKNNRYAYEIYLGYFDEHRFVSSAKDVSFFCLVEGIPIRSMLSKAPDKTFFAFSYGGASLKRADE